MRQRHRRNPARDSRRAWILAAKRCAARSSSAGCVARLRQLARGQGGRGSQTANRVDSSQGFDAMNFLDRRLPERFWDKCIPEPNSGCWLWTGHCGKWGHGRFRVSQPSRRMVSAYRFAYEARNGVVADNLVVDHLCKTPQCCNPAHLEPVSNAVNVMRGDGFGPRNAAATHCVNGHPFDQSNTRNRNGHRKCGQCEAARSSVVYRQRIDIGLCGKCGRNPLASKTRCRICLDVENERYRAEAEAKLRCGEIQP